MMLDLTLEKACKPACQSEQIKGQVTEQSGAAAVCEVAHKDKRVGSAWPQPKKPQSQEKRQTYKQLACPAKQAEYSKCGKRGHYTAVCHTLQASDVHTGKRETNETDIVPWRFYSMSC